MGVGDFVFRRVHERKEYGAEIAFSYNDRAYKGILQNLSLGGAFIESTSVNQFSTGDIIVITIPFSHGKKFIKRQCRIQWMNDEGFAVEFL